MSKKTLLLLFTIWAILGLNASPLRAQELDLDEIDIFGESEPTDATQPPEREDGFGDMGDTAAPDQGEEGGLQIASEEDLLNAMQQANEFADQGNCDQAIAIYSVILQNPQLSRYAPALFERGKCFVEVGELQLALEAFDLASQYAGQFPGLFAEALIERGKVMMDLGNYQDALDVFNQAVTTNPTEPEFLFLRGKAQAIVAQTGFGAAAAGINDAIKSFTRALSLKEDYVEALEQRASAYVATGQIDKAIDDYEQAVTLSTEMPNLQARRGSAYQVRGDRERGRRQPKFAEVIADYQAAAAAYSKYLALEEGKTLEDYEEADPDVVLPDQVYISRAAVRISLANELERRARSRLYEEAIDDCHRALDFNPESVGAYFQQGVAQRLLNRYDDAIDSYTELAALSPQFAPEAVLRRGIIWYYKGEIETARADLEEAMEYTADGRASFWVGATYAREGDPVEARRFYTRAIRENPGYLPAYNNRGLVNMQLGLYDRAYKDFDFLVRQDRNDSKARQRREVARQMMNTPRSDPFDYAYDQPW